MTKKYFPNNYNKIAACPAEFFEPMEYDVFMDWKMNGWEMMPTTECIIRTVNCKTGKVKSTPSNASQQLRRGCLNFFKSMNMS